MASNKFKPVFSLIPATHWCYVTPMAKMGAVKVGVVGRDTYPLPRNLVAFVIARTLSK